MRYQRGPDGRLQLSLSDAANWNEFERWAAVICRQCNGRIVERIDGLDQRYWDIEIDGRIVTLHLEHYLGICLFAAEEMADEIVRAVGSVLGVTGATTETTDD